MFKVGDKVRCVNDSDGVHKYLTKGEVYEIKALPERMRAFKDIVCLKGHEDCGFFSTWRFELVEREYPSPVITVPARRELKTGIYGKLGVHTGVAHPNHVGLTFESTNNVEWCTVDDLDELIFTLTQVREFLKDG